jgi:hypothetical protein
MKFSILVSLENKSRKLQDSQKYDKNNGHFTRIPIYIYDHNSLSSS